MYPIFLERRRKRLDELEVNTLKCRIKNASAKLKQKKLPDWNEVKIAKVLVEFAEEYSTGESELDELEIKYTLKLIECFEESLSKQITLNG